jgi:hypothetical protein
MLVTGYGAMVLAVAGVIAVGRIGYDEVNAFIRKLLDNVKRVTADDVVTWKRGPHAIGHNKDGLWQNTFWNIQVFITYSIGGYLRGDKEGDFDR